MRVVTLSVLSMTILSACASNPPVTMHYSLPRADLQLTVVRTVACDANSVPITASTITPKVIFSPDPAQRFPFAIKSLDGPFSNAEVGITLLEDGRLAGFNASQAGQGSEIVEPAIMVGGLVFGLAGDGTNAGVQQACKDLKANSKDGVATLTFAASDNLAKNMTNEEIKASSEDAIRANQYRPLLKPLCYSTSLVPDSAAVPVATDPSWKGRVFLNLRQPAQMLIEVKQGKDLTCNAADKLIWAGRIFVPQRGTPYQLPIPGAPVFGKQSITLTLTEAGAISGLKYGYESGAAAAMTSVGKTWTALKSDGAKTDSERAAEVKGEADLIAQQERLVLCKADPQNCPR